MNPIAVIGLIALVLPLLIWLLVEALFMPRKGK
jgi:hypothetical protein